MPSPFTRFKDPGASQKHVDGLYEKARIRSANDVPVRPARPAPKTFPVGPERPDARRRKVPVVPWGPEDQKALDRATKHNPAFRGRTVPDVGGKLRAAGRGLKGPAGLLRRVSPIGRYLDLIDLVDDLAKNPLRNGTDPIPSPEWAGNVTLKCTQIGGRQNPVTHVRFFGNHSNENSCGIDGQAASGALCIGDFSPGGATTAPRTIITLARHSTADPGCPASGLGRFVNRQIWWVHTASSWTGPTWAYRPLVSWPMPNANNMRRLPGNLYPQPDAGQPAPTTNPEGPLVPISKFDPVNTPWAIDGNGIPRSPRGRRPRHRRDEKERKTISRDRKFLIWLFQALDNISEGSEVVDCVFSALPQKTQNRWAKGRPNPNGLTIFGNAGQYGTDGAEWKGQAVFHNFQDVDVDAAMKCIIINHFEDKLYGGIHQRLPVNTGNALNNSMMELADWIAYFEEKLGL